MKKDQLKLFNKWMEIPENGYLGSNYGRPNTEDPSVIAKKCIQDLPSLSYDEVYQLLIKLQQ
jgi:hypothetical protein